MSIGCLFHLFTLQCVIVVNLIHHMLILPWVPVVMYSLRLRNILCFVQQHCALKCILHPACAIPLSDSLRMHFECVLSLVFVMLGLCLVCFVVVFFYILFKFIYYWHTVFCQYEKKGGGGSPNELGYHNFHSIKFSINAFKCKMSVIINKSNVIILYQTKMSVSGKYKS